MSDFASTFAGMQGTPPRESVAAETPTVLFIDDSATMREVIKVAFRRENIQVIACHDAASAFAQIEQTHPDVVISDVIMPDKDGYEVCEHIRNHPALSKTPVILMSGVVNKAVAEKAFAVKADELIRKPFQPQDLITRVKHLLHPAAPAPQPVSAVAANAALSSIFSGQPGNGTNGGNGKQPASARSAASPAATAQLSYAPAAPAPRATAPMAQPATPRAAAAAPASGDVARLRMEILRLEGLVRKLQAELEAEREYSRALEAHFKTLQGGE
ncbi:MAG TPA: response regulator [Terriglobales bacterium]|nr:response regulator [Terriglobales bacterium]